MPVPERERDLAARLLERHIYCWEWAEHVLPSLSAFVVVGVPWPILSSGGSVEC